MVRTRFAPSPTGYLHIGGARTALFSWAYARKHGGKFILRIEDTDRERSTGDSTQAILDAMRWLKLGYDEGPFYQMQRLDRYAKAAEDLINRGHAYRCYASREELDTMREQQRARGEKPRYDGRWRPENARGQTPPAGVEPVIRFRNPDSGEAAFGDMVKGPISVHNAELDDLVIMRTDGVPTYNFGVVVDDLDMNITHVIRGDDHVNNTVRQVNIFRALGAQLPFFAHIPMILGADGERLSKRHGAVSVMQYEEEGYLPEGLLNYLARLGWSHGNEEIFSMDQLVDWFDMEHVSRSAAQFNPEKLSWVNAQWMKSADNERLARMAEKFVQRAGCDTSRGPALPKVMALLKERASTLVELGDAAVYFYRPISASAELKAQHYWLGLRAVMTDLQARLAAISWDKQSIAPAIKAVVEAHGVKMPKVAMPLRVMLTGTTQTPSIDATLELMGRDEVLKRLQGEIEGLP
ncbi:MAG: glutamate--tRNA ligase [Betaproteobacteria bacterium]|nr:glutamate--tRNA ligase [Betaproteobacteria bacterium]